jgi:hypothetical protein
MNKVVYLMCLVSMLFASVAWAGELPVAARGLDREAAAILKNPAAMEFVLVGENVEVAVFAARRNANLAAKLNEFVDSRKTGLGYSAAHRGNKRFRVQGQLHSGFPGLCAFGKSADGFDYHGLH